MELQVESNTGRTPSALWIAASDARAETWNQRSPLTPGQPTTGKSTVPDAEPTSREGTTPESPYLLTLSSSQSSSVRASGERVRG
jgi:hypothetical protein